MNFLRKNDFFKRFYRGIAIGVLCIFSILIFGVQLRSKKILDSEAETSQINILQNVIAPLDQHFQDVTRTLAGILINKNVQLMLSSDSQYALDNFSLIVQDLLFSAKSSNKSITAIYLYSDYNKLFVTDSGARVLHNTSENGMDSEWIDLYQPDKNGVSIFAYTSGKQIAGTFCIVKEFNANGKKSLICMKTVVPLFSTIKSLYHTNQYFYIISDDNQILFSQSQEGTVTTLSDSEHLAQYTVSSERAFHIYKKNTVSWALTQQHSDKYPWSYVICNPLSNYDSSISMLYTNTLLLLFAVIFCSLAIAFFITYYSSRPISNLRTLLDTYNPIMTDHEANNDDIKYIADQITQYVQLNQALSDQLQSKLSMLHNTHLQALQFQINPHFMFNTLNMLNIMAEDALGFEHEMPKYTKKLICLLRYSLESDTMVSLQRELHYTDIYLELLNRRYNNTLQIYKSYDNNILDSKIPRLIIQPLVENAAFHGFTKRKNKQCIISIRCWLMKKEKTNSKYCVIEIKDNGDGMDTKILHQLRQAIKESEIHTGRNVGVKNVAQRLKLCYPNKSSLEITSEPDKGSCFTITIPYLSDSIPKE